MKHNIIEKIWQQHQAASKPSFPDVLGIDFALIHEVTSAQAFQQLADRNIPVRHPDRLLATIDHSIPTRDNREQVDDPIAAKQMTTLRDNCKKHGITLHDIDSGHQGIVHVIGPELGVTQPGMTLVCGDSHTATHGAFGALAHGIGTSEVEHVMATQCLIQRKMRNMLVKVNGKLAAGVTGKDIVLAVIGKIGTAGGNGCAIEFGGEAIQSLSMEGRMTICNMAIEAGARVGLVAVDQTTIDYVKGRPFAPSEAQWEQAVAAWQDLHSDVDAEFDVVVELDAADIEPQVTWGNSPEMVLPVSGIVPNPAEQAEEDQQKAYARALEYMGLKAGQSITDIKLDSVFIGSCTNSRIEDLRAAASIVESYAAQGKKCSDKVTAIVVPGSYQVKEQAEKEGLDKIFIEAGFEWREPGCSMCLAMNDDRLAPGERCAATSNRNFEGRQGPGGRTHLVSPAMAAAAAIAGHFVDVRTY